MRSRRRRGAFRSACRKNSKFSREEAGEYTGYIPQFTQCTLWSWQRTARSPRPQAAGCRPPPSPWRPEGARPRRLRRQPCPAPPKRLGVRDDPFEVRRQLGAVDDDADRAVRRRARDERPPLGAGEPEAVGGEDEGGGAVNLLVPQRQPAERRAVLREGEVQNCRRRWRRRRWRVGALEHAAAHVLRRRVDHEDATPPARDHPMVGLEDAGQLVGGERAAGRVPRSSIRPAAASPRSTVARLSLGAHPSRPRRRPTSRRGEHALRRRRRSPQPVDGLGVAVEHEDAAWPHAARRVRRRRRRRHVVAVAHVGRQQREQVAEHHILLQVAPPPKLRQQIGENLAVHWLQVVDLVGAHAAREFAAVGAAKAHEARADGGARSREQAVERDVVDGHVGRQRARRPNVGHEQEFDLRIRAQRVHQQRRPRRPAAPVEDADG